MQNEKYSRRALLNQAIAAAALIPGFVLARRAIGAVAAPLDPADPMAKALAYVEASAKPDQKCANCAQFQGKESDLRAGCSIFPGKTVAAAGWCSVWAKKAG
jgi:High potential iron-sulfur protein